MDEDGYSGNAERSICVTDSALGGGNGDANDGLKARELVSQAVGTSCRRGARWAARC